MLGYKQMKRSSSFRAEVAALSTGVEDVVRTSFPSWSSTPTSTTSTRQRLPPSRSRGVREEQWGGALGIGVADVFVIWSKTIDLVGIFIYFSALPFFVELSFQPSNSNLNFTPAVFD